ncbi:unnamed protein product [Trichogramma brassicae]|uniref:Uncharacterized protein n=1 Tax=Trichogramma brassicae TaxID=86971 RepID=A0A6H5J4J5_9HYME|nr:unnamed protein product [Trichogramma brassicae]
MRKCRTILALVILSLITGIVVLTSKSLYDGDDDDVLDGEQIEELPGYETFYQNDDFYEMDDVPRVTAARMITKSTTIHRSDCVLKYRLQQIHDSRTHYSLKEQIEFLCQEVIRDIVIMTMNATAKASEVERNNEWALEQAKKNVLQWYPVVGVLDNMNETIRCLEQTFPLFYEGAALNVNLNSLHTMILSNKMVLKLKMIATSILKSTEMDSEEKKDPLYNVYTTTHIYYYARDVCIYFCACAIRAQLYIQLLYYPMCVAAAAAARE